MEKVPVSVIDITKMSDYRKDAHTGLYTFRQGKLLTPKQKEDRARRVEPNTLHEDSFEIIIMAS
jgi:hypothetical protein